MTAMCNEMDRLAKFEEYDALMLDGLHKDIINPDITVEQMYQKYSKYAAGRGISIALTEKDVKAALTALRDVQDRAQGKPTEKKEVEHRFAALTDNELDAKLLSELDDMAEEKE